MGVLSFSSWQFAVAGAVCAAGPIVIHLLNRRRYQVVHWAAMDFLRQALKRNRKILQIRDLVLLALRTLAVLLFGAALARPYFASGTQQFDDRQPLHAIVVVDNSLSMGYELLDGSLLDKAKERARDVIEKLPPGSRATILAACDSADDLSYDPHETKDSAVEALAKIQSVDRTANMGRIAEAIRRAGEDAPEFAKRVVLIGDQQALNWRGMRDSDALQGLPPIQIVSVAPAAWENTWISDLRVQDGLADIETPATIVVAIAHRGSSARRDLQVTVSVGETIIGQQTVSIEPGPGTREVSFECLFSGLIELPEPGQAVYVPVRASIAADRLPADDERFLAVPVVAALPVVFVDQYGSDQEDVLRGRLGETRHLRKLLAPRSARTDAPRQLISVRHVPPEALSREVLSDARLVVVAGVHEPGEMTELLVEYVLQGGQVLLAAGAEFDPAAWNDAAWRGGDGILPLPLGSEPMGHRPEEADENLRPFFLSFESLANEDVFQLAGVSENDLKALYAEPFFFKAVQVDESAESLAAIGQSRPAENNETNWLVWASDESNVLIGESVAAGETSAGQAASPPAPRVLARYDLPGRPAFLVSRRMGRGEVLFCSSGLLSSWNTLPKANAVLIFDRILRGMIQRTMVDRNYPAMDRLPLPLPAGQTNLQVTLTRPGQVSPQPIDVSYVASQQRGVTIPQLFARGIYRVRGYRGGAASGAPSTQPIWDIPLVVNGSSEESDLTALPRAAFEQMAQGGKLQWIEPGAEIDLVGGTLRGQRSWWWLAAGVLTLLLVEMAVLGWPSVPFVRN